MALRPCITCGALTTGSYCPAHAPRRPGSRAWAAGSTRAWRTLRQQVLDRDGHRCIVCGTTTGLEVHHRIPRSKGGADSMTNLVTLCRHHHADTQRR